jgi:hypothetical protein
VQPNPRPHRRVRTVRHPTKLLAELAFPRGPRPCMSWCSDSTDRRAVA